MAKHKGKGKGGVPDAYGLLPGELRAEERAAIAHRRRTATPAYHQELLKLAMEQGHTPQLAIIVAQMALELSAALAIESAITKRGVEYLGPWIRERLRNNTNLVNEVVVKLYVALTGDQIQNAPFWPKLKAHAERRHGVIHSSRSVDRDDASESIEAVSSAIAHMESVRGRS